MSERAFSHRLALRLVVCAAALIVLLVGYRFVTVRTAQAAKEEAPLARNYTRNVAIVLYEGVEVLDFAGPAEVFAAAANQGADRNQRAFKVFTVAPTHEPLTSQGFLKITPDYSIDDAPSPDIVVIPGGGSQVLTNNEKFMRWASPAMENAKVTLTVCTGAFVPAKAGLLDGLTVTTHHGSFDALRKAAPKATVIEGKRFVDNGTIITSGGVSAGIDGALHTIARFLGRRVADSVASYMEYHWTPESYLAGTYPYLNPSLDEYGRELQQASVYEDAKDWGFAERVYRSLIERNPRDGFGLLGLAGVLQAKGEFEAAIEAGKKASAFDAVRADALVGVACGYARLGKADEAFSHLKLATASGFKKKWLLEREPDLAELRGDARYGALVQDL